VSDTVLLFELLFRAILSRSVAGRPLGGIFVWTKTREPGRRAAYGANVRSLSAGANPAAEAPIPDRDPM